MVGFGIVQSVPYGMARLASVLGVLWLGYIWHLTVLGLEGRAVLDCNVVGGRRILERPEDRVLWCIVNFSEINI